MNRPITVLQFGEGNFLRAFADYFIDVANEKGVFNGRVLVVKAIRPGDLHLFEAQRCSYSVILRGKKNGAPYVETRQITALAGAVDAYENYDAYARQAHNPDLQFIISNTTEAGIVLDETDRPDKTPPESFPGKLTKFLFTRYGHFNGAPDKGLILLPTELIENNGHRLRDCCLRLASRWGLPEGFCTWLTENNTFCNTLVDRIVTGFPHAEADKLMEEIGRQDRLLVAGEPFALWVIAHKNVEKVAEKFPLDRAGLPVIFTQDLTPYRERKVRILNGAHTASALAAFLAGVDTVGEMMQDADLRPFIEGAIYDELSPFVPLPADEVRVFADSVIERFENPFIQHNLLSVALNSVSKFKVRVLPTILECHGKTGQLPTRLSFSLAALVRFYTAHTRDGVAYEVNDDAAVLDFFAQNKASAPQDLVAELLARVDFWGRDLTQIASLVDRVSHYLQAIQTQGMRAAIGALPQ